MSQPNVLFFMTDHQTAATLNSSACHTPNLDRLATRGVRFRRCYTVNAICSPARATLFTGVHVHSHGMYDCTHTVDECRAEYRAELPTWPRALEAAGYRTAYFGKWHVERSNELAPFGWQCQLRESYAQWRQEQGLGKVPEPSMVRELGGERGYRRTRLYGVLGEPGDASVTAWIYSRGAEHLEQELSGREPWCLFCSTPEPHDPYMAPREFFELYDPASIARPANFEDDLAGKPNVLKRMKTVWRDLTWEDYALATCCFYAVCTNIDRQVGRVIETLERIGQLDNTLIVFTADHGDMMGGHGLLTKGVTPYEEVYNIPLLIADPGAAGNGQECHHIVSLGDLCPTLLELCGQAPFDNCQFRSLRPLLEAPGRRDWTDEAYAEFHGQRYFFTQRILWRDHLKYVLNGYDFDEMYDLKRDPAELHNVAEDPAYAEAKTELLRAIWRQVHATGDATLANAHYWTLRFWDLGPDCVEH